MALPVPRSTLRVTTHTAPRRALALGAVSTMLLSAAAAWSTQCTVHSYAVLDRRATISTVDAVPLVAQAVLSVSLAWAAMLVLLSIRTLRRHARLQDPSGYLALPAGVVGRIAAVLLAATLITSTAGTVAPRAFATTHSRVELRDAVPAPSFSSPRDEDSVAGGRSCPGPAPSPGWRAAAPARATAIGTASAPLVTGCAGAQHDLPQIVVRRGDSLWTIVARQLQTEDPTVIDAQWPRWYAVNRATIGPDPDLIYAGQVLQAPPIQHPSTVRQGEGR